MKLIIGGAFQGKNEYAKKTFEITKWADGMVCSEEEIFAAEGVLHFHEYIKRLIHEDQDPRIFAKELMQKNPNVILVTNELGCGVVPVDAFDRKYREATGRVCTDLAAYSDQVIRVFCGIGQVIKG